LKAKIGRTVYDTDNAANLGCKYVGDFGQPEGYEEKLYSTESGKFFLYGAGGIDSPYGEPSIKLLTDIQANKWRGAFSTERPVRKKAAKATKTTKAAPKATTKPRAKKQKLPVDDSVTKE
jgi:hypothetical protein